MAKLLEKPEEIRVSSNAAGVPLSLSRDGKRGKIIAIYNEWRVADQWWGKEIERHYFRVRTSKGLVCDIFHDVQGNGWYLAKIHD